MLVAPLLALLAACVAAAPLDDLGFAPGTRRLIQTSPTTPAQWMDSTQMARLLRDHTHFMDITETQELGTEVRAMTAPAIPTQVRHQAVVKPILARGTTELMRSVMTKLTEFNNRYYRAPTGEQSSNWLFGRIQQVVAETNRAGLNVTVTQFAHASWPQKSIIARIEGVGGNAETVIVGAHQDSINGGSPMSGRAPGADDDGSGTVTILEALRMLLAGGYQPTRPVEFQWYAGEEAGLLGSQAIAKAYATEKRVVAGMLQLDMTMYPTKSRKDIGILTDNVSQPLTQFLRTVVSSYSSVPHADFRCGYGCSDHASWTRAGYPSAMPFESSNMRENRLIHTPQDTMDTLDFEHGLELAKVAAAFAVEMSQV